MLNWIRRIRDAGVVVDADPVAVLLPEPLRAEVFAVRGHDGEVAAVRLVRQRTGLDLLSAVRAVRAIEPRRERSPTPGPPPSPR